MRAQTAAVFHETVNFCFSTVLETLGETVRNAIYDRLAKKGIQQSDISTRFDDVIDILIESFGGSARVIIYKTVMELHQQYSIHTSITYQDSLKEHLSLLKERIVADHLLPKRVQREGFAFTQSTPMIQGPGGTKQGF